MFKGSITALVSPFRGHNLDLEAFEKFINFQITNGTNGIVPCGTTGESPTISHDEHKLLIFSYPLICIYREYIWVNFLLYHY